MRSQRQEWFRNYARSMGESPLAFVGSARVPDDVIGTAARIRTAFGFDVNQRRQMPTWTDALRHFIEQADGLGILVMCNGVVHNNNHRHLDPREFRGFAMADDLAPLVFINGADTKAGQMFTLAHELAHIWLGQFAVSDSQPVLVPDQDMERWCNEVAAELLVPLELMRHEYNSAAALPDEANRLARRFKVSTLVILRRMLDVGGLTRQEFWDAYHAEVERLRAIPRGAGGNFYLTQAARVSKRFAAALVTSTLEGQTRYNDAFRMLGFSKLSTFQRIGAQPGGGAGMSYLLDSDVFIQVKNLHYGLDFCPAFWDWLIAANAKKLVFSTEKVGDEIQAGADELATWAAGRGDTFFLKPDSAILPALATVSSWATGQNYEPAAVSHVPASRRLLSRRSRTGSWAHGGNARGGCSFNQEDQDSQCLHWSRR